MTPKMLNPHIRGPINAYPVILERGEREVLVDFVDIPWAHTIGDDEESALLNAVDCLETAFEA